LLRTLKGKLICHFQIESLPEGDLDQQLRLLRSKVEELLDAPGGPQLGIGFDCTTGRGILRVLGYECVRQSAARRQRTVRVVFCDSDSRRIITADSREGQLQIESHPIVFRFPEGAEHLIERFAMYDVEVTQFRRLWPTGDAPVADVSPAPEILYCLYHELCSNERLRAFCHSYWSLIKEWKRRQIPEKRYREDHVKKFLAELNKRLFENLRGAGLAIEQREVQGLRRRLNRTLNDFPGGDGSLTNWLEVYLEDRRLKKLRAVLQKDVGPQILARVPHRRHADAARLVARELRGLIDELRRELNHIAVSFDKDLDPRAISPQEHINFRKAFLQFGLPAPLLRLLVVSRIKLSTLFERAVGQAIARTVCEDRCLREAVDSVYQNVIIRHREQIICELDTLVLFRTGDLLAFESKSHFSNSDRKKIEANIKQLRDFGGAYSGYRLIFPLTSQEIGSLAGGKEGALDQLQSLGMSDAAGWAEFVRMVAQSRDQQIVGLDQLRETLRAAGGIH
jgi:hypothetical protein